MSKSKLKKEITKNLTKLEELIDKVRDTQIDIDDSENWDYDYYSELQTNLEDCLKLLRDEVLAGKRDEFGDPIVTKQGLLSLLEEWKEETSEDDDEE